MMTFIEFHKERSERIGHTCFLCGDAIRNSESFTLCVKHDNIWINSNLPMIQWAYEEYKKEVIRDTINVWNKE